MQLATLLSLLLMLASYGKPAQKIVGTKSKLKKITASSVVLAGRCAVIVRPDTKKIALMRKQGSEDDYTAVVNDNEYYLGTSVAFLDSVKVKQIAKPAHGIIIFKSSTGRYFKVSLVPLDWGIILFNGRDKPIEADVTDIAAAYQTYMKK